MGILWVDIYDIAVQLNDQYTDVNPKTINFVDLRDLVVSLENFNDHPDKCGEKILEAIQQAWIDEID